MDSESFKKMGHSLRAFSRLRTLTKMSKEELADMPKEVMIACAADEIAIVWDKLPEHLQNDIDILKYQYCVDHYNDDNGSSSCDVNDGPIPRKIFCCYCKVRDVNVVSDNKVDIPPTSSTPTSKRIIPSCCLQQ